MRHQIALLTFGLLVAGCAGRAPRALLGALEAITPRAGRTHAVLINGGGRPDTNYQSHLLHVRSLVELLRANAVRPEDIAVFSSDGADPEPDLATRDLVAESERWLIPHAVLRPPIVRVDSVVDGVTLRPARKEALRAWFEREGARLGRRDTLLLYVTDHGHKNAEDLANNTIVLWGEELSVTELRELLALLDPRVRVVMLMSQCYSGSFAHEIFRDGAAALPSGNICGYFASPADRRAYGCYPENRGRDGVGYSFHFLDGLGRLGSFSEANRRAMVADGTPDAPLTSSDFFLDRLLRAKATAAAVDPSQLADALLAEAWQEPQRWETEIRLLDRIGHAFGVSSPRSLVELDKRSGEIATLSTQLATYASQWRKAFEALKVENLQRFVEVHPEWRDALAAGTPSPPQRSPRTTTPQLMAELEPFSKTDPARYARLLSLRQKAQDAAALSYRAEVRLGAVLRMRAVLTSIAGRVYVERRGLPPEQAAVAQIAACEDLALSGEPRVASAGELEPPEPFPPMAEDERLLPSITPAWIGIGYKPLPEAEQKRLGTHAGAVTVVTVQGDSPASAAGLVVGDVLLGPVGAPFDEPNQVREWTMRSEIGTPQTLAILRDGKPQRTTLRPGQHPLEVPRLPGPPKVGDAAPPVRIDLLNGGQQIARNKPRLLFFWATWCQICKKALPEVRAFEAARDIEVLAITDESPETVTGFRQESAEPLPRLLATDRQRITFQAYGVSGVPTFVLLDADGIVRSYKTGYGAQSGLGIEGWQWRADATSGDTSADGASSDGFPLGTP